MPNIIMADAKGGQYDEIFVKLIEGNEPVDLIIPDGVTAIRNGAFYYCTNLRSVYIPSSVTTIGTAAFSGCTSLTNIEISQGVTTIGSSAFTGAKVTNLSIPSSVKTIDQSAFSNLTELKSLTIPSSVLSIGKWAFRECTKLKNVETGGVRLAEAVFYKCTALERAWIRSTCTTIDAPSYAFNALFAYCPTTLAIYAEPSEKPSGWNSSFNKTGESGGTTVTVTYGQTTRPW